MSPRIFAATFILLFSLVACAAPATPTPLPSPPTAIPIPTPSGPVPTSIPPSPITPIPTGGSPVLPAGVSGKFVFAPGDGSIWVQDTPVAPPHVVVKASTDMFSEAPAFSPDGNLIAFALSALNAQATSPTSIQLVDVNGQNQHALEPAPDATSGFGWPAFSPDGKWVYYTLLGAKGATAIQRVPTQGGTPEKVLDNGRQAVLAADGKQLAFVRLNLDRFTTSLWVADAAGHNPQLLLNDGAFLTILAPHFSPDGQWILFSASGPPRSPLHALDLSPTRGCEPPLLCALAQPAYADGLPWDMWIISVDGKRAQQLTAVGADSPWPAWSRDGKYVAFMDTSGMYLVDVAQRTVMQLNRNRGHGVFDWWMPASN